MTPYLDGQLSLLSEATAVRELQESAFGLLDRMIAVGKTEEAA